MSQTDKGNDQTLAASLDAGAKESGPEQSPAGVNAPADPIGRDLLPRQGTRSQRSKLDKAREGGAASADTRSKRAPKTSLPKSAEHSNEGQQASDPATRSPSEPSTPIASPVLPAASLDDLVRAYQAEGRPDFQKTRDSFQKEHGRIRESFFAKNIEAGGVIVRPPGLTHKLTMARKTKIRYEPGKAAAVPAAFEETLRRARAMESESSLVLAGRTRKVLVDMLFGVSTYLLGVLDSIGHAGDGGPGALDQDGKRVKEAVKSAGQELDRLVVFQKAAAKKASLRFYLFGLPFGAILGGLIVRLLAQVPNASFVVATPAVVEVCVVSGAVGAIVSVMSRITIGRGLVIDTEESHMVTLLAGAFRPLIGAVFGLALYVLVKGDLVPLAVPSDAAKENLFFSGLAFLSGFSERWAQDTIVHSTPKPFSGEGKNNRTNSKTTDER